MLKKVTLAALVHHQFIEIADLNVCVEETPTLRNQNKMCTLNHFFLHRFSPDALKTVCVSAGENVSVPCPKIKERAELVTFNLFQNMEQVYNHTCSPGACTATKMGLHENTENTSVSFVLSGVNASDHALYRCEMKHAFPPPLITEAGDLILVLVKGNYSSKQNTSNLCARTVQSTESSLCSFLPGHQCNRTPEVTVTAAEQYCGFYWILILALVSLYSIIATVLAIFNCVSYSTRMLEIPSSKYISLTFFGCRKRRDTDSSQRFDDSPRDLTESKRLDTQLGSERVKGGARFESVWSCHVLPMSAWGPPRVVQHPPIVQRQWRF